MDIQTAYQYAIRFAALKHAENAQMIRDSNVPYLAHVCNVAMEILIAGPLTPSFDTAFAVQVALLHDTLEDTTASIVEVTDTFGVDIAAAVEALTKNEELPHEAQMPDTIDRIKKNRKEVWAVKLADRITNLQAPPVSWTTEKLGAYYEESIMILESLKGGNAYLEERLAQKIEAYKTYLPSFW